MKFCPRSLTLSGHVTFEFYCHVHMFVFVLQLVCGFVPPQYHVCVINTFTSWMNFTRSSTNRITRYLPIFLFEFFCMVTHRISGTAICLADMKHINEGRGS